MKLPETIEMLWLFSDLIKDVSHPCESGLPCPRPPTDDPPHADALDARGIAMGRTSRVAEDPHVPGGD